ncbi:MAG TPA: disulfide bond formation protein DsbA, partial [Chloroflexi bacterium]|nr:disulfide bond formation protein DsbA [Chloroflexota bacterium]
MMMVESTVTDIYFDFVCPYVYRAALWLETVEQRSNEPLRFRWRYFPLAQINNKQEGWKVWEQPVVNPAWNEVRSGRGLRAMWAHEAARQQGQAAANAYRLALLRAVHEDGLSLSGEEATQMAAERAGLDLDRW